MIKSFSKEDQAFLEDIIHFMWRNGIASFEREDHPPEKWESAFGNLIVKPE